MWSFSDLLPVIGPDPSFAADVGLTATVEIEPWSEELGVTVLAKNEGTNPSGSFKDRGLAAGVAFGARLRRPAILPADPGQRRRRREPVLGPSRSPRLSGLHARGV